MKLNLEKLGIAIERHLFSLWVPLAVGGALGMIATALGYPL